MCALNSALLFSRQTFTGKLLCHTEHNKTIIITIKITTVNNENIVNVMRKARQKQTCNIYGEGRKINVCVSP